MKKNYPLKGYGQMFRSGMTMRQKWAADKRLAEEEKMRNQKPSQMGKNE